MPKAPVLFVSHGAPTFALQPGRLGLSLTQLGRRREALRAVLVVSAHWQTRQLTVSVTPQPETIHDFGGFPPALYRIRYPVPDPSSFAHRAIEVLSDQGATVEADPARGLDHGAWVPLLHLLPPDETGRAPLPVFQVSLPVQHGTAEAWALGRALAPLRDEGVLIVGSGSLTHNLRDVQWEENAAPAPYAQAFADWVTDAVAQADDDAVKAYRTLAPHAVRAHPTEEHFLPLLTALGARSTNEPLTVLDGGVSHGVLSMTTLGWGW